MFHSTLSLSAMNRLIAIFSVLLFIKSSSSMTVNTTNKTSAFILEPGTLNYHAMFLSKKESLLICSGTLLSPRWIISTIYPLRDYSLNKFYVLFGPPFFPKNLTSRYRVYINEKRSMLALNPRLLLLKTQVRIFSDDTHTFINIHAFRSVKTMKSCSVVLWSYPQSFEVRMREPIKDKLIDVQVPVHEFALNGSLNCDIKDFSCIIFDKPKRITPVNYGSPVLCNVGFMAILCGTPKMEPILKPIKTFATIHFTRKERAWVAKTISEPDGPRPPPCNGAKRERSLNILAFFVLFNVYCCFN